MSRRLWFATLAAITACGCWSPASATVFYDQQAQDIAALWNSGQGVCWATRSVVNPTTGAVEQAFCSCVTSINGTSVQGNVLRAVDVTLGPEQPCNGGPPVAAPTPQQRADAAAAVARDDAQIQQIDTFLQNIDSYRNDAAYNTIPAYRAEFDQWKASWLSYGPELRNQYWADRQAQVSIANAPVAGGGAGRGAGAAPGAGGTGLLGVGQMQQ